MWKKYLSFSRGQRVGIIVLITFILIAIALNFALPLFFTSNDNTNDDFLDEAKTFRENLQSLDSIRQVERQRQYEERYVKRYENQYPKNEKKTDKKDENYTLFAFDPNKVDSAAFIKLGLKPYTVSAILNYRKKDGVFRTNADFAKIYSVTPEKFAELEPYITIKFLEEAKINAQNVIVELNSADTTELMQVKGIGRGYARSIVRFRNETGGFISVEQLQEVYGMRPENYERIRPFCIVNANLVQKIKINTASVDHLNRHPYLDFYQSKAAYELRREKGKLKNFDELKSLKEFTPETLAKIQPYLSFE